ECAGPGPAAGHAGGYRPRRAATAARRERRPDGTAGRRAAGQLIRLLQPGRSSPAAPFPERNSPPARPCHGRLLRPRDAIGEETPMKKLCALCAMLFAVSFALAACDDAPPADQQQQQPATPTN